jgi:hypothetical protein
VKRPGLDVAQSDQLFGVNVLAGNDFRLQVFKLNAEGGGLPN